MASYAVSHTDPKLIKYGSHLATSSRLPKMLLSTRRYLNMTRNQLLPASGEGVTQDESASSKGFTKAPAIIEESRPPAEPPPTKPEIPSIAPEISTPTQPTPMQTVSTDVPAPPPIPVQPHRSERTIHPTWVKAATDAEKSRKIEVKATSTLHSPTGFHGVHEDSVESTETP
jgi:hypothetical protein